MLIENREARVLGPSIGANKFMILRPGVNNIPDEDWALARETAFVQSRLGETLFERSKTKGDALEAMGEQAAMELVGKTMDRSLLEKWGLAEKRRKVQDKILSQIVKLNEGRGEKAK